MTTETKVVKTSTHPLANLKAYAALAGSSATALLAVFAADSVIGQVLTVVAILSTVLATWAVPNAEVMPEEVLEPLHGGEGFTGEVEEQPDAFEADGQDPLDFEVDPYNR